MTALKELLKALLAAGVSLALAGAAVAEEQKLNRLADAPSPYLRQHATNPVDWFPWGPEALERARAEDKPILVSVGYAACHWCHVMREESFENEEIAAFLNEHFVSIKIDRERRPDLDEQFMVATELISGTGGWPNTVFLTPEGRPFFAGTYFPPDLFWRILLQVVIAWETDREAVSAEGARIAAAVSRVLDQSAPAREVSAEAVTRAAASILEDFDPFHGGFGTAPKFPREPMLLFLLDEAERNRDATVLEAVLGTLDGMIRGGIHDHVGGGFHRYAVDPEWHVPHFEKMLYTQALMGRLLTRAFRITCEPRYARAAERVFAFVLREMRAPGGAFISALDADSLSADGRRVEGAFYTWTPAELAGLGAADAELVARLFGVTEEGDVEGRNVLALTAPLEELAEELGTDEAALTARLDQLLARMAELRASRPRPLADEKVVMSWAALMSATLAEASVVFARDDWLRAAEEAAVFLLEEMWLGGERARVHFEGEASVPAQLPDHAALGLMALALHDAAREPAARARWLAVARDIAEELSPRYGEPGEGFRLRPRSEGLGVVRPVDDAEIPSGNGLALEFLGRLSRRAALAGVERDALRLAGALSGLALELPAQRAYALTAIARLERGETGHHRFAARGAVELRFSRAPGAAQARLSLDIAPGWHINAHEPLEDYLIPTGLALDGRPVEVAYPEPVLRQLGFSATPLALYEGRVELDVPLPDGASGTLQLTIQACNDEVCLQPETLAFPLW